MTKLPSNLQPIISDEFEPADGSQRYLQLFERLSLLIGGGDAGEIGIRACELITEVLEVAACSITLLSDDGQTLDLLAATHIPRSEWPRIRIPVAGGIYESVVMQRQGLLVRSHEDFRFHFKRDPDPRYSSASCVLIPLIIHERVAGAINIAHPLSRRWFGPRDMKLLTSVARLVASALHSADEYQEAVRLQKKMTDLFNSLHVGIIVVDSDRRISQCNHSACRMFGIEKSENLLLEDALGGIVYNVCSRLIRKVEEDGGGAEDGIELKRGNERRLVKVRVLPCMEEMIGAYMIMIEEAGQEEEVRQLRESQSAKHSFLAIISHELRTPLTVIRAALPMLEPRDKPIAPETLAQVRRLLGSNCQRLTEVVNSILYVTEIESGTLELAIRPTDLHKLLQDVISRHEPNLQQKKVGLEADYDPGDAEVHVDNQRMYAVFSELLNNAIKFSNADTTIQLRTRRQPPWFEVTLTNHGQSIDPCQRKDIFQKFYQGNQALTRTVGGCGLGLFLVYNLVRLHGGLVELLDPQGEETTFRVRLPLEPPEGAAVTAS